jgi:hypothetical protein
MKRKKPAKHWESYEKVAQFLLNRFAEHFKLGRVEDKQIVPGKSGTVWKIDAKGVKVGGEGFLVVECRRYTKSRLNQKNLAALAYVIQDTGAEGGITVSPLDLQRGAKIIAANANVQHVILDQNSTTSDYVMRFLNQFFIAFSESVELTENIQIKVIPAGDAVDERKG